MELIAAGDTPIIIIGAEMRVASLLLLLQVEAKEVYSLTGQWSSSEMCFRYPGVLMSTNLDVDEYRHYAVNSEAVVEMKGVTSA